MAKIPGLSALAAISSLASCTSIPTSPSMMALPGSGRSFDQFRYDDYYCREFASEQIGGTTPNRASISSSAASAAVGAGLGAAAGAALGSGRSAAIGAGAGLVAGSLAGTHSAGTSRYASQQRYDTGYVQCMYGKGHRVSVSGHIANYPSMGGVNQYITHRTHLILLPEMCSEAPSRRLPLHLLLSLHRLRLNRLQRLPQTLR